MRKFFELINAHKFIFLRQLDEPCDNQLRLVVAEALVGKTVTDQVAGTEIKSNELIIDASSRIYEFTFNRYVAYSVRDEIYCSWDKDESFEGRLFCVYSKSKYLDFVRSATIARDDYPGPLRHFGFNCLNHVVDVVSDVEPIISELNALPQSTVVEN